MFLNILVIMFLALMTYYWSKQGVFSALLHLVMVIVAGAVALAVWEPLAQMLLGTFTYMQHYAWGVALIVPLLAVLLIQRVLGDKLIKGNVHTHGLISQVLGGLCGLGSAILTGGLFIIGLGFLGPPGSDLLWYQPYGVDVQGQVVESPEGTDLWVGIDEMAAGFYGRLSTAGFYSEHNLASHRPEVARQAAVFHLRNYFTYASLIATPDSVGVEEVVTHPTSEWQKLGSLPKPAIDAMGDALRVNTNRVE